MDINKFGGTSFGGTAGAVCQTVLTITAPAVGRRGHMARLVEGARTASEAAVRRHAAPAGAVTEPLSDVLEPDGFTPRLLALLSNALVWRESHELRRRFGLGTNDWRVISAVATRPGT